MFFAMNTRENGLYYGENGSSRFSNRLYYGENDKKRVFSRFFESQKKQETRPQELKSVFELMGDPLTPPPSGGRTPHYLGGVIKFLFSV